MLMQEMLIFYNVVHQGSFSLAANVLGVSKSFVSKHITKLEDDLKTRLLNRTTRQLSLTEAGEIFYQHCQSLSLQAEEGYNAITSLRNQPSGRLKISAPPALALHVLAEPLVEYQQRYPDVKIHMVLESRIVDIVQQGYDLALRAAPLPDSTLISQKIFSIKNVLCASPTYLKKHDSLTRPDQLHEHTFGTYSSKTSAQKLNFSYKNKSYSVEISSKIQCNQLDFISKMVTSHTCMAVLPEFMVKTLIHQRKLVVCLPKFKLAESPLYAVYPQKEFVPLKVRAFIEVLKNYLREI